MRLRQYGGPALISVALVALMATTGLLANRVSQLRGRVATLVAAERAQAELPLGTSIPTFTAYALDGTQIPVVFNGTAGPEMTLLFVYSPECHICDTTWPQWNHVREAASQSATRQVFLDLTGTSNAAYLQRWGLTSSQIITHISPLVALRARISVTPQLILTNRRGEVTGVWTGALGQANLAEVLRVLRTGRSTLSARPKL
jgi:hypothetical protein